MKLKKLTYKTDALFENDPKEINVNIINLLWSEVTLENQKFIVLNEDLFNFYEEAG